MKLKRGDTIFLSERGYNGFFYPGKKGLWLVEDVDVKVLSWLGGGDKVAVSIPNNTLARDFIKTVDVRGPVWINQKDIKK